MSQQPSQWSPEAVQIFTAARQIPGQDAQAYYIAQACGANAHLRWEVDWLMQWDRGQQPSPMSIASTTAIQPFQGVGKSDARGKGGWKWGVAIAIFAFIFVGFLGVFIYGAYRGVKHLQLGEQADAMDRAAHSRFEANDFAGAARGYEQAIEIRKKQYGENHSKVSEMYGNAASAWYYDREYDKAAAHYEKAYQLDLKRVGPKDKETLENQRFWAICLLEGHHVTKALDVFNDVLARRKEAVGPAHQEAGEAMLDLGRCRETMGQTTEALANYEAGYEIYKNKLTAHHQDSLHAMKSIVHCLDNMGRFDDARDLIAKTYELHKTARGFDDSQCQSLRQSLCERLEKEAKWDQIVKIQQEVVDDRLARLSGDQPLTVSAKEDLAKALVKQGQIDRAIELLLDCRDKCAVLSSKDSDEYQQSLRLLADAYNAANSPEKGITLFQEFADEQKNRLGPRSPATLQAAAQVGWRQIRAGEISQGEVTLERVLAEGTEALGLQHEAPLQIAMDLATHYRKTRQFAKETEIRRRLAQQQMKIAGIDDATTRERMESQADAELEAGNFDAAIDLFRRLHDFETNRSGSAGIVTLFQSRSLTLAYLRAHQEAKAFECTDQVMTRLERNGGRDYWTSWTAVDLGLLLARLGNANKSCTAYEFALGHRENGAFQGEQDFERKFAYWSRQSNLAMNTEKTKALLTSKLEELKKSIGAESYLAKSLRMQMGMVSEEAGDWTGAEKAYRELESLSRGKSLGWLSQSLYLLGRVLRKQSKLPEAEAAIREAVELKKLIAERAVKPGADQRISTSSDVEVELARVLIAQNKLPEAEALLAKVNDEKSKLDFLQEGFEDVHCRAQALHELIEIGTKLSKQDEAAKWKAELDKIEAGYPGASRI